MYILKVCIIVKMQTAFINSPLGITKIVGDENGISEISVTSEGEVSKTPSMSRSKIIMKIDALLVCNYH